MKLNCELRCQNGGVGWELMYLETNKERWKTKTRQKTRSALLSGIEEILRDIRMRKVKLNKEEGIRE